jgi:hypothetical protein
VPKTALDSIALALCGVAERSLVWQNHLEEMRFKKQTKAYAPTQLRYLAPPGVEGGGDGRNKKGQSFWHPVCCKRPSGTPSVVNGLCFAPASAAASVRWSIIVFSGPEWTK